ncbi:hypothetical protein RHMOL_Rhmol02G0305500 [Rhododendron molle]|uniref:Uncharacterized protein n=1 Tax=Rhododendron molle TaxID=49168 RepID=A0ACC0PXB6_RHOML|nr:hypothetical protein RHMOL_Rhmol02G0305500 [Rhododendron molle]
MLLLQSCVVMILTQALSHRERWQPLLVVLVVLLGWCSRTKNHQVAMEFLCYNSMGLEQWKTSKWVHRGLSQMGSFQLQVLV